MKTLPKILFVDDESLILAALQRALRPLAKECECVFATGSQRAIELLRQDSFDIIVSDMRMPDVDGATLLELFRAETPDTVRIVLSGQANADTVVRSLAVTHQYMSKPVDNEYLKSIIRTLLKTSVLIQSPLVRRKISQISALPIRASTLNAIRMMAVSEVISYPDIVRLAKNDAGLLARLIHLTGVAAGDRRKYLAVEDIVAECSTEILLKTFESDALFAPVDDTSPLGRLLQVVAQHALHVAENTGEVAAHLPAERRSLLYMSALMHDLGKVLIPFLFPEIYNESLGAYLSTSNNDSSIERKLLGVSHAEIGAYLASVWGMPGEVVEGINAHNSPIKKPDTFAYLLQQAHSVLSRNSIPNERSAL